MLHKAELCYISSAACRRAKLHTLGLARLHETVLDSINLVGLRDMMQGHGA